MIQSIYWNNEIIKIFRQKLSGMILQKIIRSIQFIKFNGLRNIKSVLKCYKISFLFLFKIILLLWIYCRLFQVSGFDHVLQISFNPWNSSPSHKKPNIFINLIWIFKKRNSNNPEKKFFFTGPVIFFMHLNLGGNFYRFLVHLFLNLDPWIQYYLSLIFFIFI